MTTGIAVYDGTGELVLDANSKVLMAKAFRTSPNIPTGTGIYSYFSGDEEYTKTVLVRPSVLGTTLKGYTDYANTVPYLDLCTVNSSGVHIYSGVEVCIAEVGSANTSTGFLDVYDEQGNFSWSLNSFTKCVRILKLIHYNKMNANTWLTVPLVGVTNMNNVFIVPPYSIVANFDNGTDDTYSNFWFEFKIVGSNLMFRPCGYANYASNPQMPSEFDLTIVEVFR